MAAQQQNVGTQLNQDLAGIRQQLQLLTNEVAQIGNGVQAIQVVFITFNDDLQSFINSLIEDDKELIRATKSSSKTKFEFIGFSFIFSWDKY